MNRGNFFRRTVFAAFIVLGLIFAAVAGAAVQIFDGVGEWHTNDDDNQQIAMARAQQRAQIDAQKRAGVYLKTFSRSVNAKLTDDEISAVTNNIIDVFDVHIDKKVVQLSDRQTTILYTATLKAKIDPEGIYDFIKRNSEDKVTIIQQNKGLQEAIQKNDELTASLVEKYSRATSQAEKDSLRKQLKDADREFLANHKLYRGAILYYSKDYNGALKLCNEAIKLNPSDSYSYILRGATYLRLKNYKKAIADAEKGIELNPNDVHYAFVGAIYYQLKNYKIVAENLSKAIELNPNNDKYYFIRGEMYHVLKEYNRAIADFDKAIQMNSNDYNYYFSRGMSYFSGLENYAKAITDFDKTINLNPNHAEAYFARATSYFGLKNYEKALDDYNNFVRLSPNNANAYVGRGACYKMLGDNERAMKDFVKAKQLGYNF